MSSEYSSFASLPASFFLAAASMSGMAHKRKGWLEASKIFLFIGFPVAFTYLQAQVRPHRILSDIHGCATSFGVLDWVETMTVGGGGGDGSGGGLGSRLRCE